MRKRKYQRQGYSYKRKLAGTMFVFLLVPILLIGCITLLATIRNRSRQADIQLALAQQQYHQEVSDVISSTNEQLRYVINYKGLNTLLSSTQRPSLSEMLDAMGSIDEVVESIFYQRNQSTVKIYTNNKNIYQGRYIEIMTQEEEQLFSQLNQYGFVECSIIAEEVPTLRIQRRYQTNRNDGVFHVIQVDVLLGRVVEEIPGGEYTQFAVYVAQDSQQLIPISPCSEGEMAIAKEWLAGETISGIRSVSYPIASLKGTFYTFLDVRDTVVDVLQIVFVILLVVGLLLLAAYYLVNYTVGKLTGRLMEMINAINSDDMKYTGELLNEQYDEFDIIQNRLMGLKDELRMENDRLLKLESETLNHKMSPHYLYNNLSAIKWKCNNEEIDRIVDTMVRYYRNMFQKSQSFNPVSFETGNLEEYVELLRFSYESMFVFDAQIQAELHDYRIPANIIQPLVENAFLHGINNNINVAGRIALQVFREEDKVVIQVTDNGNCPLAAPKREVSSCTIIDRRLKLYFGDDYGLVYSQRDGYTIARIEMPFLKEMTDHETDRSGR